ncbi:glycosyltransferase [Photobacterium sp. BZF1]|uniref:glycosyltransferase family 2 protein n=1 Tax=Photobacterium sp. BZF1 TaxID=1904457 RepID=UPI0016535596|nr:glycosyltransferase [Photobacterium sp. BZF1]MBC7001864.1 glycosyltransferase [Photobacterium sp. BZF1]
MKFIVISAVYNMSEHLKENIDVLKAQTYANFEVYFGDDLSTDNSCDVIEQNIQGDDRFRLVRHQQKLYSMGNIAETIKLAQPADDDVIVLIDGDDKLADATALEYLKNTYSNEQCLMTFGSYTVNGKTGSKCSAYPSIVQKLNLFRYAKWRANHLKTFKYSLWKQVNPASLTLTREEVEKTLNFYLYTGRIRAWLECRKIKYEDLVTEDNKYVRRCSDKYITSPLLEMAGERAHYIDKVLYHYLGPQGPHNFGNSSKKWSQRLLRQAISLKPRYKNIAK